MTCGHHEPVSGDFLRSIEDWLERPLTHKGRREKEWLCKKVSSFTVAMFNRKRETGHIQGTLRFPKHKGEMMHYLKHVSSRKTLLCVSHADRLAPSCLWQGAKERKDTKTTTTQRRGHIVDETKIYRTNDRRRSPRSPRNG